jgi:hypothetical protein
MFLETIELFKKALKEAGVNESLGSNVMHHFADLMRMKEPELRRDVQKIDSGKG